MSVNEYDIVRSLSDLNEKVKKGCKGTVVLVYEGTPKAYEVEFVNDQNETIDVLTVRYSDIQKVDSQ